MATLLLDARLARAAGARAGAEEGRGRGGALDLGGAQLAEELLDLDKHGAGVVDDAELVHLVAEHGGGAAAVGVGAAAAGAATTAVQAVAVAAAAAAGGFA